MHIHHDPDMYETVSESKPCTACNGDRSKCFGQCNGSTTIGRRMRPPEEVAAIKAERRRREEDDILQQADAIRARRQLAEPPHA